MKNKILYWLAKHGIVEYNGKFVIADYWYVDDKDIEDDNIIYYYAVAGRQIPFMNKVRVPIMHNGRYVWLIQQKVKKVGAEW